MEKKLLKIRNAEHFEWHRWRTERTPHLAPLMPPIPPHTHTHTHIYIYEKLNFHIILIKHCYMDDSRLRLKKKHKGDGDMKWMIALTMRIASDCPFSSMDPCGIDSSACMYLATSLQVFILKSKFLAIRQLQIINCI